MNSYVSSYNTKNSEGKNNYVNKELKDLITGG